MSFLDRFKPQPRWKNADPAVRAAAVSELTSDPEHIAILRDLAATDEDVRVRRAAAGRLQRSEELVGLVRGEQDEELRRELTERLVAIAASPAETDGEAALALEGLDDPRQLAAVARLSPFDTVRTAALGRVHDVKALGSVARNAAHGSTALDAVARIADRAELLSVAVRTDHKDAGIAALERAVQASESGSELHETLDMVATRAKNKSVAKRARAMAQAIEETEAARRIALEAWQQRVAAIVARVEGLAAAPATGGADEELDAAEAEWRTVAGQPEFELDPDTAARFGAALDQARAAIAEYQRLQAERRAEEERRLARLASRRALVERLQNYGGPDAAEEIERTRAEWEAIGPDDGEEIGAVRAELEAAAAAAQQRHENRLRMEETNARLTQLAGEAELLAGEEPLQHDRWKSVSGEWATLSTRSEGLDEAVVQRYQQAADRVRRRGEEKQAAAERAARQQVQRVEQLIDRATRRSAAEDLTLREADRLVRDLRAGIDAPPAVPEQHALVERLKAALAAVTPRLHELREMDEWKRFANAAVQEELIARAEALRVKYRFDTLEPGKVKVAAAEAPAAEPQTAEAPTAEAAAIDVATTEGATVATAGPTAEGAALQPQELKEEDLEQAARELHDIQERWKTVAEAPRAQAQALWHRYRQAADPIQARLREFFARRNEERKGNLEQKLALIARAEQLADSTDWIKTADELKHLQAEWQRIGPVPRQETKATWKRFRDACDRFFTRRNADLAERKETWTANLAKKEALCARAEELAASRDWDRAAAEIRRLQAEWKGIGPVRRNKSEAVWQRFRTACDTFFDRYKRRDEIELESKQADREQLVNEIEAMSIEPVPEPVDAAGLLERVRSLRSRWNQSTPVVRHGADPLSGRFVAALERTVTAHPEAFRGTELDIEANRQKMEKLCARVEGFLTEATPPAANSSQALAEMLREALAANTIGGRGGDESKWRAMAEDVRQAQSSWNRLGPVPGDAGRALNERFHRATSRFFDLYKRKVPPPQAASRRPVGTR